MRDDPRKYPGFTDWAPAALAFATLAIAGGVFTRAEGANAWLVCIPFVTAFPMCFVFVGIALSAHRRRIEKLESTVATLEQRLRDAKFEGSAEARAE